MEHGARLSTSRNGPSPLYLCQCLLFSASLVNLFIQGVNNYRLQNEQRHCRDPNGI